MLTIGGNITADGKLRVFDQKTLDAWRIKHSGHDVVLSLKIKRKTRSSPQNAYYWGVIIPLITQAINDLGNDFKEEETHEFLKSKFNAKQIEVADGHYLDIPQSTSKMDTVEFMTYIENIQQFASMMLGIYIPSPNEQAQIDFK